MGGYGSGRRKLHTGINECLALNTSLLLKRKMLTGKLKQGAELTFTIKAIDVKEQVTEKKHSLMCLVKRYGDEEGEFSGWKAAGHVTFRYGVKQQGQQTATIQRDIPLVVTHPNYGGVRWWYLAPCCGRRCRVLYLPTVGLPEQIVPECRECMGLHYASQLQSYIERHVVYEKYLLSNYGYWWAQHEYRSLKEHYFVITPEWAEIREKSVFARELEVMKHLIRTNRVMLRTDVRNLRRIKSEEDRVAYINHLLASRGENYVIDLARMIGIYVRVDESALPESTFEQMYLQEVEREAQSGSQGERTVKLDPFSLQCLIERKREAEEDLQQLKSKAKAA